MRREPEQHTMNGSHVSPASPLGAPISRRSLLRLGVGVLGTVAASSVAVPLAGCSSSGPSASSTGATSSDGSYTLVNAGELTCISNLSFPPMEFYDDSGNPTGFDIDVSKAVADKLGLQCNWLPTMQFDTLIPTIKSGGKADITIGAITITDAREQEIDFTDPYLDSNQSIVMKADSTATKADDVNVEGYKVAVEAGTTGEAWAQENLAKATIVPLDDQVQAMTGVQTGLYDLTVGDLPVLSWEVKNSFSDLKVCVEVPTGEQYGIVVSKDNPNLTAAINGALADMASDGTMDSLKETWFGTTAGL